MLPSSRKIRYTIMKLLARDDSKKNNIMDFAGLQERIQPFMDQGRYEQAINECLKVWRDNKDNVELSLLIGRLYHRAGNAQEAKCFFTIAGKHANGDTGVLRRVEMFKRATALLPNSRTDIENFCDPDIVLVQAPGWGVDIPPLATAMLTSFARKHGYKVLPIDLNIEIYLTRPPEFDKAWDSEQAQWFWNTNELVKKMITLLHEKIDAFVELLITTNTPMVGFTLYSSSKFMSLALARMLKTRQPNLQIVFGGPHVSRYMEGQTIIGNPFIDAVVQGEGELTLIDFMERVKIGRPLTDCPGLLVCVDGHVVDTGDRDLIKDLNQLPVPYFDDYAFDIYRTPNRLPLLSSRGCPNRCIFCNERLFWKKFRGRSAENIFAEIQAQLARYPSVNFLYFQDSLLNGNIRELDRLADLIIESGLKVRWGGQAIIRKEMTRELLTKLKRSGCIHLSYGLETPSESLMLKVGKVMSKGADINAIAEANWQTGLAVTYNFMFGLPGETEEDAFEAHEFLRRNKNHDMSVNPSPIFCSFVPGTSVYENPERYGLDLSKGSLYWESTDGNNTYITRLKRFEDFCRLVNELGISTEYPSTVLLDRNRTLANYYALAGNNMRARQYYDAWLAEHPDDNDMRVLRDKIISSAHICETDSLAFSGGVCFPENHSDDNWIKGISKIGAAFFVKTCPQTKSDLKVGRRVVFADDTVRTIVRINENDDSLIVILDGTSLDGNVVGYPKEIKITDASKLAQ